MTSPRELYRTIPLSQGQVAIVDVEDFEWLSQFKWHARKCATVDRFYVMSKQKLPKGRRHVYMHRLIMGLQPNDNLLVDHINRDSLDNRRINLRLATRSEQQWNQPQQRGNKSGFKGTYLDKRFMRWVAEIKFHHKRVYLGSFPTAQEAYAAYCKAALLYHGEFACTG